MAEFRVNAGYEPRPVSTHGVRERAGWQFKIYAIRYANVAFDTDGYAPIIEHAIDTLPQPAEDAGRPGVGFMICHQGRGVDYLVMNWWNHENELVTETWIRRQNSDDSGSWSPAPRGYAPCVWDLEVIWFERNTYVEMILSSADAPRIGEYAHVFMATP